MRPVKSLALVGIGGYGDMYCSAFQDPRFSGYRVKGVIDPKPLGSRYLTFFKTAKIPIFKSVEDFLSEESADLAIIASPMQFHAEQTCLFLNSGSNVLCEKPLCTTLSQAAEMIRQRDAAGGQVTIGYQWSFSRAVQSLKKDVAAGLFGSPKRLRTLVLWPRDEAYYKRNSWAGFCRDSDGRPVFDSPVNNACAHYLHNMFYILGRRPDESASPVAVTAETYRAYEIQNYDTAGIRCRTAEGVEIMFFASHACCESQGPTFEYEFENATIQYRAGPGAEVVARFADGSVKNYGSPDESHYQKLVAAIESARTGSPPLCGIEASLPQTQVMVAAQQSRGEVVAFPDSILKWQTASKSRLRQAQDLDVVLKSCFEQGALPTELGAHWAVAAREVACPCEDPRETADGAPKLSYQVHVKRGRVASSQEEELTQ